MNPNEYQKKALRTECDQVQALANLMCLQKSELTIYADTQLQAIRFLHGSLGIAKEAGELLSIYEKWIHYNRDIEEHKLKERVLDEGGDVLWYLSLALHAAGVTLEECMQANIRKLAARYPERYSDQLAADENRDREAERSALLGVPTRVIAVDPASGRDRTSSSEVSMQQLLAKESPTLDDKGRIAPHSTHTWADDKPQTRCVKCGAYKHLRSGFFPCTAYEPTPAPDCTEQDGHGFGHSPDAPK